MQVVWIRPAEVQKSRGYPLLKSPAVAGFPSPAEDWQESLDLNQLLIRHPAATFLIRAMGNSMTGAGIFSGDVLVVDRSLDPIDNRVIIADIEGELLVKRLRTMQGKTYLLPENQDYSLIEIQESTRFQVWGIVTHVIHAL